MRHPASILHDKNSRTCYLCVMLHDNWNEHRILDEHHVFGGPNRKNSEEYGLKKYKRLHGCFYNFIESYKKVEILDRIKLQLGWIQQDCYLVLDTCTNHIAEMEKYSWDEEKDIPEDRNDHTINSQQYGWIPYRNMIGFETEEQKR